MTPIILTDGGMGQELHDRLVAVGHTIGGFHA